MKVEVLCATMHQKDLSKYSGMNIQTDAVFSNQAEENSYAEEIIGGNTVKMITTPYRGVGRNRNLGLLYSSGDILIFGDDDLVYSDGYEKGVTAAFEGLPNADMIIFNCTSDEARRVPVIDRISRAWIGNSMRYGTYRFAIKKESLQKCNLRFSELFGGGSRYCSGEDNLFVREVMGNGLKVYLHPFTIAHVSHGPSTWFEGFNEKYIFDNGALMQASFPVLRHAVVWYFAFKFAKMSKLGMFRTSVLEYAGMKAFRKGLSYDDWRKGKD
jgi:glycosyltransferase involved in cell wall biosynthesis